MTAHKIQAAIDRAEAKRRELAEQQPDAMVSAKILAMLPKAAEVYREQVALGPTAIRGHRSGRGCSCVSYSAGNSG